MPTRNAAFNYTRVASPVGPIHVLASQRGLSAIYFDRQTEAMERRFPTGARENFGRNPWLLRAEAFLHCYLAGDLYFWPDITLDLQGTAFQRATWKELQEIAPGATRSYGDVARRLGSPTASRAVGAATGKNPVSILIPCHRAVGSSGKLTGYAGGLEVKRFLLEHEARCSDRAA